MSSILTNTSAMVALQTLRGINSNLAQTQSQISTGKSVANARDNAAVWAISRTMESDVAGFKAISDSLSLGSATVGVARQAAETVTDLLTQMKSRIVAAQEQNVDRDKIQEDVVALRDQIDAVVGAAQFNGLNLINDGATLNILASLDRDAGGTVSTNSIEVAAQDLAIGAYAASDVFDAEGVTDDGDAFALTLSDTDEEEIEIQDNLAAGDSLTIRITTQDTNQAITYTVTEADVNDGEVEENVAAALRGLIVGMGIDGLRVELEGETITLENDGGAPMVVTGTFQNAGSGGLGGLSAINVATDPAGALARIEGLIETAIEAASSFGSAQMRIDTQSEFIKNLTDSLTTGIGALVDADMEAASARLQALQVQQQLATQSLSIANQQPQNILALFR